MTINASGNAFNGIAVVDFTTLAEINFDGSAVSLVVDQFGLPYLQNTIHGVSLLGWLCPNLRDWF